MRFVEKRGEAQRKTTFAEGGESTVYMHLEYPSDTASRPRLWETSLSHRSDPSVETVFAPTPRRLISGIATYGDPNEGQVDVGVVLLESFCWSRFADGFVDNHEWGDLDKCKHQSPEPAGASPFVQSSLPEYP